MSATPTFDRRITPARPDLAAAHLRGQVDSKRFVQGLGRAVLAPSAPLRPEPRSDIGIDTELLRGEVFTVYDQDAEGWSWGQADSDGYVGWVASEVLGAADAEPATHRVAALRTFVFPGPNIKLPVITALSFGSRLTVRAVEREFAIVPGGFVWAGHLRPAAEVEPDAVGVAERFIGIPYLWGGRTTLGLDCSGLVQTALAAAGIASPRDTDMQQRALGAAIDADAPLQRGDLVFWLGHVGLMRDATTLLHANGYSMNVVSEPLTVARDRILAQTGKDVTSIRRL